MHIILTSLPSDALARTLTVEELSCATVVSALEAAQDPLLLNLNNAKRLTVVSENLFGGFSTAVTAVLETIKPGAVAKGAILHAVFYGDMTEREGNTARDVAHAWGETTGFADCAVSLRTLSFTEIATPRDADRAPTRAAWLLGASGQDGAAAGRAMRAVSRMSRLHGAHTLLCGDRPLWDEETQPFAKADAVVTGFSLYRDQIPAYMLCHLRTLAQKDVNEPRRLYALVCAVAEQRAGKLALERLEHFALRAGMSWGQGLVISANSLSESPDATVRRTVRAGLSMLAITLMRGQRGRNTWVASGLSGWLKRKKDYPAPRLCDAELLHS